jgi:cation-transporting ATPase 13A1
LVPGEAVIPKRGKFAAMKIFQRFHFSSALKRMAVVAGYSNPGSSETHYIASVKVREEGFLFYIKIMKLGLYNIVL